MSDQVWSDFVKHRKRKRSDITQTAIDGIRREAEKAGWSMQDAIREIVTRGWIGFNADWVEKRVVSAKDKPAKSPQEWLDFCEERVRAARRMGNKSMIEEWEVKERAARARLPRLQVVK